MARKIKRTIEINEEDISVKDILKDENATVEQMIAAQVILEDQIEMLKACTNITTEKIKEKKYDDVVGDFETRGLMNSWESPVIQINTKYGGIIEVSLSKGEESGFTIDKKLSDKTVLDSVVPQAYKKVSILLDKKKVEEDFEAGTLPPVLKTYCSKAPFEVLKMRKSVKKANS